MKFSSEADYNRCDSMQNSSKFKGRRLRRALPIVAALLLTACASKLTRDNWAKIQKGMSTAQVKALLGSPSETQSRTVAGFVGLTYIYHKDDAEIKISFLDDHVTDKEGDLP